MATKKAKSSKAKAARKSAKQQRASKKAEPRMFQSSPITIGGGGSVKLKFDEDWYRPGVAGGFLNARDELITVLILNEDNDLLHNLYQLVEGKRCTVTVHCKYRGEDRTIEIDSQPGGPLAVRFTEDEFPYDRVRKLRYNSNRKIKDPVEVRNHDTNTTTYHPVPTNGKCGIVALNKL